jgi:hypothetical protein
MGGCAIDQRHQSEIWGYSPDIPGTRTQIHTLYTLGSLVGLVVRCVRSTWTKGDTRLCVLK